MPLPNKLKITIIIILAIAIVAIVVVMLYRNETSDNPVANKAIESVADKKVSHEFQDLAQPENKRPLPSPDLVGPVHNQYGIRDDILTYIENTIPHWNKDAWKAATTIAVARQDLYYKAQTDQEANAASDRIVFATQCLALEFPPDSNKAYLIFKKIEELMENTRERRIYVWEVSDKYFAGKSHRKPLDISDEKLQQKCKAVDY